MAIFGVEPAMAMDTIVNSITTEWFAFFYFGYFFLLALHVIPILFLSRRPHILGEFSFGMLFLFTFGHIGYMLVPGYGPYKAMSGEFQNAFPSGMWLDMVMSAVASGGAQKDIFPSLHTAAPTLIALFSFRHRREIPFRYTWPLVAFAAINIIGATMFLRWHYVIDVVAGLTLATTAALVCQVATRWDLARRARENLSPQWPEFFPKSAPVEREKVATHVADPA
jgi:membrane-associated phospholipid phosphatase